MDVLLVSEEEDDTRGGGGVGSGRGLVEGEVIVEGSGLTVVTTVEEGESMVLDSGQV